MIIVCRKVLVHRIKSKYPSVKCYDINAVVNTLFDEMADALQNHEKVIIRNFGTFCVTEVNERTYRTPDGQIVHSPKTYRVKFVTGVNLANSVKHE